MTPDEPILLQKYTPAQYGDRQYAVAMAWTERSTVKPTVRASLVSVTATSNIDAADKAKQIALEGFRRQNPALVWHLESVVATVVSSLGTDP